MTRVSEPPSAEFFLCGDEVAAGLSSLGAGPQTPKVYRMVPIPMKKAGKPETSQPIGLGPRDGARVAPQHCPILRPGLEQRSV